MWNIDEYLCKWDELLAGDFGDLIAIAEGRQLLTREDPLLFAMIYLRDHITAEISGNKIISMSDVHLFFCEMAKSWIKPLGGPQESRNAFVCPREMGKTTWMFLLIPMWAAAHGHTRFIAAFADTAEQAQLHLATFRRELDENELLNTDYKALCTPAERAGTGRSVADRQYLYISDSGFIFSARGMDTSVRGLKYGKLRPDTILIDDAEPDEGKYNAKMAEERKNTMLNSIFPLNIRARVVITGTTTMYGSMIHQMVRGDAWVAEQNISVHHFKPFTTDKSGAEHSIWPEKWSIAWLQRNRSSRWFLREYMNEPLSEDGIYWSPDIYIRAQLAEWTHCILAVDPAVTSKDRSDYSAASVIKFNANADPTSPQFEVSYAWHGKVTPEGLRDRILGILTTHTEVSAVIVEVNQGGELWALAFKGLPVRVLETTSDLPKNTRAAMALREYEIQNVVHLPGGGGLTELEQEQCSYPGLYDDMVDTVSLGILDILHRSRRKPRGFVAGRWSYA